jgi:hypothetical protein
MSEAPPFTPHLAWAKGGHAAFLTIEGEIVVVRSTTPAPPGARLEADLVAPAERGAPAKVRMKSHGSKREADGTFTLKGRLVDVNRALRERLLGLLPAKVPSEPR